MIPSGEKNKATRPLAIRFNEDLLKRIDRVAKDTHNSRTDAIMHLLRWALTRYEEERSAESKGVASAG